MYQELKQGSLVEIYNEYLPFVPRKPEGTSIGNLIEQGNYNSFEVDVKGIEGHSGTSNDFTRSRWYVPRTAIKGLAKTGNNYIEEVE